MRVECHIEKSFPSQVRETTLEKVTEKLERFEDQIQEVSVAIRDLNGPKGGVDIQCRVHVVCEMTGESVVEQTSENVGGALKGALDRMVRTIAKKRDLVVKKHQNGTPSAQQLTD